MKLPNVDTIVCPTCNTGRIKLQEVLRDTLAELRRTPGFTAGELHERFPGVGVSAINNRLEDLRAQGFVRRERDGHAWRYYPIRRR